LSHNSGSCIRSVAPWVTVLSDHRIHKEDDILQIYFCVIFHKTRHHAQAHINLRHLYTVPFLWPREEHRQMRRWVDDFAGHWFLWRLVLRLEALLLLTKNNFLTSLASAPDPAVSNQNFTDGFLKCYFFQAIARYPQSSALFRLLCMTEHSFKKTQYQ